MMTVTNQARCEQHYEQRYEQWAAPLRGRPGVVRALNIVNHGIVVVFYAAYALLLGWACVSDPWKLAPLVLLHRAAHCSRWRGQVVPEPSCLLGLRHRGKLVCGQRARCRRAAGCGCRACGLPRPRRRALSA